MNIFQLTDQIRTTEEALQFLRNRGVLRSLDHPPLCDVCGEAMRETRRQNVREGVEWKCQRWIDGERHVRKNSIRYGSFLEKSRLELKEFILLAYTWALGASNAMQEIMCGHSKVTVVQWNQWFRDICSKHLLRNPIRLGGIGNIVQIGNEFYFRTLILRLRKPTKSGITVQRTVLRGTVIFIVKNFQY